MFRRRQVLEPPPRPGRQYATRTLPASGARPRRDALTVPLIALVGAVIAAGLTVGVTAPDIDVQSASLIVPPAPARQEQRPPSVLGNVRPSAPPRVPRAAAPAEGLAQFILKTPGAHLSARLRDVPGDRERALHSGSMRLPVGRWIVRATAPGYQTCIWHVQVKPSHATVVIVMLRRSARAS